MWKNKTLIRAALGVALLACQVYGVTFPASLLPLAADTVCQVIGCAA